MKENRKSTRALIAAVIGAIVATVLTGTGLTLAYLTDSDSEDNIMTVGETVIEIDEDFDPPPTPPAPGEAVTKVVRIRNTGNLPCTVRARLLFEDYVLKNAVEPFETGSSWLYQPDGFYYYLTPLMPGEETEPLISEIRFRTEYGSGERVKEEDLAKIDSGLIVYSEALEYPGYKGGDIGEDDILENWRGY
jgi:predicted ribosomally synthesized peptide with SipW-like signal peptide